MANRIHIINVQGREVRVTALERVSLTSHEKPDGGPCNGTEGMVMIYGGSEGARPTVLCDTCYTPIARGETFKP